VAQLNQLQLRFEPNEDRLLLRVNTTDRREFRFWVTRRYAKLLWSALATTLGTGERARAAVDAQARQAIFAFEHERALQQANFARPFDDEPQQLPLGETPMLLNRLQMRTLKDGRRLLGLHPAKGRGVELSVSPDLLHGFTRLLTDAVTRAHWDLNLPKPDTAKAPQRPAVVN
jgi:hypothetical protein